MAERSGARLQPQIYRLWSDLRQVAAFGAQADGRWSLPALSPEHLATRQWLREQMALAGLTTSFDGAANLTGRREGRRDDLDPIVIGSHTDSIRQTGCVGGIVGVLAGIEIARRLHETRTQLDHPLEIVDFVAAGPGDWGTWHLGATQFVCPLYRRMVTGRQTDRASLRQRLIAAGGHPPEPIRGMYAPWVSATDRLAQQREGSIAVFLEMHVEDACALDPGDAMLSVASRLPDAWDISVIFTAYPLTPVSAQAEVREQLRRAADDVVAAVREVWEADGWTSTLHRRESLTSSVDMSVNLRIELVYLVEERRVTFGRPPYPRFEEEVQSIAERARLRVTFKRMHTLPVRAPSKLQEVLLDAAHDLGLTASARPPHTAHAGNWLGGIGPVGMLLLPSDAEAGVPPTTWISAEQHASAAAVLGESVVRLDAMLARRERLAEWREWKLLDRDRNWLGTLVVVGADQPWFLCNFEAQPAFEAIRPLFDEELLSMDETDRTTGDTNWAAWNAAFERINALDLRLEREETGEYYTRPFMHISGRRAQLRGLPDNWREVDEARNRAKTDG